MNNVTLYHGDCLEEMKKIPDHSIDLILTDPPYNIARKNNFTTMGRNGIDFGEWDKGFNQFTWLNEIPRLLSKNGSAVIFNDWKNIGEIAKYCESIGLTIKDMIRWEKTNPMPRNRNRRYITDFECGIWITQKNAKWVFNKLNSNYQRPKFVYPIVAGKEKTKHPTQKPVSLMQDLIMIHSNSNYTVLDPFSGSGSTGVACINTNRNFIGIELDDNYFEIAKKRIEKANNEIEGE